MVDEDSVFGCDYSSNGDVTATGDIQTVQGMDNAKQNIHNWLLTDKGFYPSIDTEYGSEIRAILGEDYEDMSIDALKIHIKNALLDNPRVLEITRLEPYITVDKKVKMIIDVVLVNGVNDTLNITVEDEVY